MRWLSKDSLDVLYEDNHLIAVYKPGGILVQGDRTGDPTLMDVVKEYIKDRYQKPGEVFLGLIHRLDRPVSGVVLFARTSKAASRMVNQWQAREVVKIYWAMIQGRMEPEQGRLVAQIRKARKRGRIVQEADPEAKEAVLLYRTLSHGTGVTLIEINLITGRKHQIRAQFAAGGHPIVGDVKYGAREFLKDKTILLLAHSLSFRHPVTGQAMTVSVNRRFLEEAFPGLTLQIFQQKEEQRNNENTPSP